MKNAKKWTRLAHRVERVADAEQGSTGLMVLVALLIGAVWAAAAILLEVPETIDVIASTIRPQYELTSGASSQSLHQPHPSRAR